MLCCNSCESRSLFKISTEEIRGNKTR
uniref:Uncharacterized protein n=1 Tax=Arundo donax TaxID=35708 RepID=A0A0A9HQE2_ARUDO